MEWLNNIFTNGSVVFLLSITVVIFIFSLAAKKAYFNHQLKMRKIQAIFASKRGKN
jgi:hypothetical protein